MSHMPETRVGGAHTQGRGHGDRCAGLEERQVRMSAKSLLPRL